MSWNWNYGAICYIVGLLMGFVLGFIDAYRYRSIQRHYESIDFPKSDINNGEVF